MASIRELNELLQLDDEAFVTTKEAAAVVGLGSETLRCYRYASPELSPKYRRFGGRSIRYRMGDLRAFRDGKVEGFHVSPIRSEG